MTNISPMYRVRVAAPEDEGGIMDLCRLLHAENGLFPLDETLVRNLVRTVLHDKQGFIGVIGPKDRLEGSILIRLSTMWYSTSPVLEEYWNFVHPDHRKSERAKFMVNFAKSCATKMGIPLLIGVVSNQRTRAKCRLYNRMLPKAGEFYLFKPDGAETLKESEPLSLRKEFEGWMDKEWPLWRTPQNVESAPVLRLWRAFNAAYNIGDVGMAVSNTDVPEEIFKLISKPPRRGGFR